MRRFQFKLAERLGKTVGELMRTLSSREYAEWIALANLEYEERLRADMEARVSAKR